MDMIDKKIYDLDFIRQLQARYKTDPGLLERVLYAFGLLEALVKVGMKFTFKGGTRQTRLYRCYAYRPGAYS